jgi:hypothetical protein
VGELARLFGETESEGEERIKRCIPYELEATYRYSGWELAKLFWVPLMSD